VLAAATASARETASVLLIDKDVEKDVNMANVKVQ
jgi:hypothetical protein